MINSLTIASNLAHDGDGLVRFTISAQSERFSASTLAWGYAEELKNLADRLVAFPKSKSSAVTFRPGSPKTGTCELEFVCLDDAGHTAVWATLEAPYCVDSTERSERASVFVRVEPAAIDRFAASLRSFIPGTANEATLQGIAPMNEKHRRATGRLG